MSDKEIRKLAAIMFTDMVGYSALSQRDEKLAQELLEEHRRLLRKIFPRFNGTEIKTIGDAFLVEFGSALEAAQCAIEIQRTLAKRDADAPADRQIQVRIGVHIGDVVHRGGDVYGDGVNIASRIEPVAGPGGICVSMDVERQVRNALEARVEKLAPTDLKNISVPMDLFRIVLPWERETRLTAEPRKSDVRQRRSIPVGWLVAAVLPLILIAGGIFELVRSSARSHLEGGAPATPPGQGLAGARPSIPAKSIAVLPFQNLSDDKENAYFADGIQDDILTNLSKIGALKVISRTSVMAYRDATRNVREIGKALGVATLLEGSVRRSGNRVRVNVQLINADNDAHIWAEDYDRDLTDVFAIQTEIAKTIAEQLQAKLSPQEKAVLGSKPTQDTEAYDLYLRAKELMRGTSAIEPGSPEIYPKAVALLEKAIARDPNFAFAYCLLAEANLTLYWMGESVLGSRERGEIAVQAARRLAPQAGETYLAEALFFYWGNRDYDRALHSLQEAARLLPNNVDVLRYSAWIERRLGRWQDCIRHEEKAAELDPRDWHPRDDLVQSYELVRDYPAALRIAARAISEFPQKADYFRTQKAGMELYAGDLKSARASLNTLSDQNQFVWQLYYLAVLERNYDEAFRLLKMWSDRHEPDNTQFPRSFLEGLAARAAGQADRAHTAFLAAQQHFVNLLGDRKEQPHLISQLAIVHAGLGRKEEALQEARHAVELLPMSRDAVGGTQMVRNLALVYCWTGETDHAIEQLSLLTTRPSDVSYGELKFDPGWDPLRGDPRFEQIVSSLAPK
jgi:adenylate cyclase